MNAVNVSIRIIRRETAGRSGVSTVLLLSFFLLCACSLPAQPLEEFRAVKLTNVDSNVLFSDLNIAEAMNYLASIGVNVVLPVVWNGAYTQYQSTVMDSIFGHPVDPDFNGRDPLDRVVVEAHRVGIEVYPWFEYGFAAWYSGTNFPRGGPILQKFPGWALRSSDGQICNKNGFDWMSAVHPEVQQFMNALVTEVITRYDVDGVEFSDRIPAMPVECGYDSTTVAIYRAEHGGNTPPVDYRDPAWMRWRADKMNHWYAGVRDLVKGVSENLFVSSSPSVYPWSYEEYLQDPPAWIRDSIAEHFIPQLYRYSFSDYVYELNNAVSQVGPANLHKLFAGILMNLGVGSGAYLIAPDYLLQALQANRARGVMGEAFFYYEGLRKNNNQLGDTLKATFYKDHALVPGRGMHDWRPSASVVNEDDPSVSISGQWSVYLMRGYAGGILRTQDTLNYAAIRYGVLVPAAAWYDVYVYRVPNTPWTTEAVYTLYGETDSSTVIIDQSDLTKKGWYKVGTVQLSGGTHTVVKVDNSRLEPGRYLTADAVMLMVNRRLSPDVVVSVGEGSEGVVRAPERFELFQNYPNPFNPSTTITYTVSGTRGEGSGVIDVRLVVYDLLGREVAVLVNERKVPGQYSVTFDGTGLSSGVYVCRLNAGKSIESRKMTLVR